MNAPLAITEALEAIARALDGGPAVVVVTNIGGAGLPGERLLLDADGALRGTLGDALLDVRAAELARALLERGGVAYESIAATAGTAQLFFEAHNAPDRLIIVGAGHISIPLAMIGAELGFRVLVLDDREEFATEERFSPEVTVRRADFSSDPFAGEKIDEHTYVALVTRGHRWDFDCLRLLLARPVQARYIGLIGSRRRIRAAFQALLDAGIPAERLAPLRAPIGLDINAETPAEIAVSIAAEMIAVRRDAAHAPTLTTRERVLERLPATGAASAGVPSAGAASAGEASSGEAHA